MDYGRNNKNHHNEHSFATPNTISNVTPDTTPKQYIPNPNKEIDLDQFRAEPLATNEMTENSRELGKDILNLASEDREFSSPENRNQRPELGVIVDAELPPNYHKEDNNNAIKFASGMDINKLNTDQGLDKEGIKEVDKAINHFRTTGDAANFYNEARHAMQANLKNSYNRELSRG